MADDDKDFTFGDVGDDFTSDDGWGALEEDPGAPGQAANEDFTESDPSGSDSVVPPAAEANQIVEESVEAGGRRTSPRMILYGLLVIVLSAAGFYYFTTSPLPPEAEKKPAPASQTLAMPERPEPVPITDPAPAGTATSAPAASVPAVAAPAAVPKGTLREVMPTEPAAAVVEKQTPPAAVSAPSSPAASAPVSSPEKTSVKVPAAAKKSVTGINPPKGGFYAIQAGAYADPANRDEALGKIRQLGFETKVVAIQKKMPVIRLLIGVYAPDEGRKKALELAKTIPSAFTLQQGKQIAVYAGSFTAPEKAKEFVDELSTKGIRITEQKAEVELTLSRVFFGRFTDQAAAVAARDRAKAVGLEADIVRQP